MQQREVSEKKTWREKEESEVELMNGDAEGAQKKKVSGGPRTQRPKKGPGMWGCENEAQWDKKRRGLGAGTGKGPGPAHVPDKASVAHNKDHSCRGH